MYFVAPLSIFMLSNLLLAVQAIPMWDALPGASSIGALVSGASPIQALGSYREGEKRSPQHLRMNSSLSQRGNLTVAPTEQSAPPLFYVYQNHLMHYQNESAIYPVNVINATGALPGSTSPPMQLVISDREEGVGGYWRWKGTMLHYDYPGSGSNGGLYYKCQFSDGTEGLYIFLKM